MAKTSTYRDLVVWQKSLELTADCYKLTKKLPADEKYGMIGQIKRSAASIPANIAEGYGRHYRGDYVRSLLIASGSLAELETHLILAVKLDYIAKAEVVESWNRMQEVGKMLRAMIRKLQEQQVTKETSR